MISVVCVYNNKNILENYLLKSLGNQTVNYELINIDNTQGKFKSASEALNYGGRKAKGDYIMFVHQDVDLSSNTWLKEVEKILDKLSNLGIAGVAGRSENIKGNITNIENGIPKKAAGGIHIKEPTKVQTVDECLTIIPKSVFAKLQFDENACNDWHLYAVDYCLSVQKIGFNSYVIPIFIYHRSPGYSISEQYYKTLKKILKKYKNYYAMVYTTMGNYSTRYPLNIQRIYLWVRRKVGIILRSIKIIK
ncbi:family 2 glycosyl transferase [Candidatus Atribacteria bacterium MT.SAG.1]|nr:family 2 glycosyl transferase [Candidatus Atribacteria bacterium MT.SAG.1]